MNKNEEFDFFHVEELEERLEMNALDPVEITAEVGADSSGPSAKVGVSWSF